MDHIDRADFHTVLARVDEHTRELLAAVAEWDAGTFTAPSLLPGLSRNHVLSHLARNADALGNLAHWARTGVVTPAYPSQEARNAQIEEGARRPSAEVVADLTAASRRLGERLAGLDETALDVEVQMRSGMTYPARLLAWHRLKEVLIHHVDLGTGFTPDHWPADFVATALEEVVDSFTRRDGVPPLLLEVSDTGRELVVGGDATTRTTVTGPQAELLAWLTGRGVTGGLTVRPAGNLPALPAWL